MAGGSRYSYATHYYCRTCEKWCLHEEALPSNVGWLCPLPECGRRLRTRLRNKNWKAHKARKRERGII